MLGFQCCQPIVSPGYTLAVFGTVINYSPAVALCRMILVLYVQHHGRHATLAQSSSYFCCTLLLGRYRSSQQLLELVKTLQRQNSIFLDGHKTSTLYTRVKTELLLLCTYGVLGVVQLELLLATRRATRQSGLVLLGEVAHQQKSNDLVVIAATKIWQTLTQKAATQMFRVQSPPADVLP